MKEKLGACLLTPGYHQWEAVLNIALTRLFDYLKFGTILVQTLILTALKYPQPFVEWDDSWRKRHVLKSLKISHKHEKGKVWG